METKSKRDSSTWLQEFTPYVNGVKVRWPDLMLALFAGESCTLMLDYEYSWLIGDPQASVCLDFKPGEEAEGLTFDPPLKQPIKMEEGTTSISWTISTVGAPGSAFVLQFSMPEFEEIPKSPPVRGKIVTIEKEVDVSFDEKQGVLWESSLYTCLGATHKITILPIAKSELLGKNVQLKIITSSGATPDVKVRPSPGTPQLLNSEGVTWILDYTQSTKNQDFSLQFVVVERDMESLPLFVVSGHHLVTVERWSSYSNLSSWPPFPQVGIQATSPFLKKPVAGVEVTISSPSGTSYGYTDKDGKYVAVGEGISLGVFNKYNNTWA